MFFKIKIWAHIYYYILKPRFPGWTKMWGFILTPLLAPEWVEGRSEVCGLLSDLPFRCTLEIYVGDIPFYGADHNDFEVNAHLLAASKWATPEAPGLHLKDLLSITTCLCFVWIKMTKRDSGGTTSSKCPKTCFENFYIFPNKFSFSGF